jgi:hypothetical protein
MPALPSGNVKQKSLNRLCLLSFGGFVETPQRRIPASLVKRIPKERNFYIPLKWYCQHLLDPSFLQLDDSATYSDRDRLRSVAGAQLFHDVLDMYLYSLFRDEKPFCDVAIPVATGDMT